MDKIQRDQIKKLFHKVKKLRLPQDLENIDFSGLVYYSWLDQTDKVCYIIYNYKNQLQGLCLKYIRMPSGAMKLGFCEFCKKHRKRNEMIHVYTKTKNIPKKVNYRSRGTYICADFNQCNLDLKNQEGIDNYFYQILEKE